MTVQAAGTIDRRTAWRSSVFWAAWLVLGHIAALQLVLQGSSQRFPHLRTWESLVAAPSLLPSVLLLAQAISVLVGLSRARATIAATFQTLRGWRGLFLLGAIFVLSATVAKNPVHYVQELVLSTALQLVMIGNALLLGLSLPGSVGSTPGALFAAEGEGRPSWARSALWAGALVALLGCLLLSVFAYQRHPHVPDELAYLIQAKMFAEGRLWLPLPPVTEGFVVDLMIFEPDRWYSTFAPGWPALLALGTLLGAAWLVNPILTAVNVLLIDIALRHWIDGRTSVLAALLYAVSPWTLFLGMSFMSHAFTLTCALAAVIAIGKMRAGGSLAWAALAGAGIGLVGITRPLDGLALSIPLGLWALIQRGRLHLVRAGLVTVLTAAVGSLVLVYNRALTGDAGTFPVMKFWDGAAGAGVNALGFGPNRGYGPNGLDPLAGHGPLDVVLNANLNLTQLNVDLFGWGIASLLPLLWLLVRGRVRRGDWLLLGFSVWVVAVQSLYYFSGGADFGARYWYLVAAPLYALSARGLQELASFLGGAERRIAAVVATLVVVAMVGFVPWRAADRYRGYRGMDASVRVFAESEEFGRSLVLIRGRRHPDYASAVLYNPTDLQADVPIYAWARTQETVNRLLWEYRDRPVWVIDGPTQTGGGFRLAAGPLSADELLAARGVTSAPALAPHPSIREARRTVPEFLPLRLP